jgi:Ca-activated chloride channel family protein
MRKRYLTIAMAFMALGGTHLAMGQTRPRVVEPSTPTPSPSPAKINEATETGSKRGGNTEIKNTSDAAPQGDEVLRIETTLVTVPVSARDRNRKFINDLQQGDFHIYENGIEQKVAYFATTDAPFTVVLVLDTSASTWSKLGEIREAAKAFVEQLPLEDQVMVTSFGMGLKVQCEATNDRQKIRRAIEDTGRGLSTHLYDAMQKIMSKYLERIEGRKAIVLFTDGVDASSNGATYESNVHIAEELDALIYSIRYDTYDPSIDHGPTAQQSMPRLPRILRKLPLPFPSIGGVNVGGGGGDGSTRAEYDRGQRYLQELAELTGGQVYEANKDLSYLQDAFNRIAAELSRQYSIGYYPNKTGVPGERRQLRVSVDRPDVAVRARSSYIFKSTAEQDAAKHPNGRSRDKKAPVLQKQPFAVSTQEF